MEAWQGFPASHRRANLEWVAQARRPATRAVRIAEIATRAARGERANTWKRP
ncbi:YdeI/OmpD-associated family protein [Roseococcus microcysteis]|uniref:YdeI/OmpD-associated family protein n=1 Tax=Roseococcus microcysteis TaxID=2771361 RepID=UPI001CC59155